MLPDVDTWILVVFGIVVVAILGGLAAVAVVAFVKDFHG